MLQCVYGARQTTHVRYIDHRKFDRSPKPTAASIFSKTIMFNSMKHPIMALLGGVIPHSKVFCTYTIWVKRVNYPGSSICPGYRTPKYKDF